MPFHRARVTLTCLLNENTRISTGFPWHVILMISQHRFSLWSGAEYACLITYDNSPVPRGTCPPQDQYLIRTSGLWPCWFIDSLIDVTLNSETYMLYHNISTLTFIFDIYCDTDQQVFLSHVKVHYFSASDKSVGGCSIHRCLQKNSIPVSSTISSIKYIFPHYRIVSYIYNTVLSTSVSF